MLIYEMEKNYGKLLYDVGVKTPIKIDRFAAWLHLYIEKFIFCSFSIKQILFHLITEGYPPEV